MKDEASDNSGASMLTFVRRFSVLLTLLFWQGGFMFYAAVVVPVGSDILGSHQAQGWITRSVSNYLNLAGLAAVLVWCWDIAGALDPVRSRRRFRWGLWTFLVLTLGTQFWLHMHLDELLDVESFRILDQPHFYFLHRWYLNISMLQWAGSMILAAATLLAWRACDRACWVSAGMSQKVGIARSAVAPMSKLMRTATCGCGRQGCSMKPLYEDSWFTFRFADDRLIPRFHLEGVPAGRQVSVFRIDPGTGDRLGLLATATVAADGWVDLAEPIIVKAGQAFVAVPEK